MRCSEPRWHADSPTSRCHPRRIGGAVKPTLTTASRKESAPRSSLPWGRVADGSQEHHALARGVGREEASDLVIEESQAGGAQAEGIRGQIQLAALDGGL